MPGKIVKVPVSDRWRVVHDGKPYHEGDTLTVPEQIAEERERSRWVERVTGKGERYASSRLGRPKIGHS